MAKNWWIYILKCSDGSLYTGATLDVVKRARIHNAGKGAKYTKTRLPIAVVYSEKCGSKSEALKREWQIKKLTRLEKKSLILK